MTIEQKELEKVPVVDATEIKKLTVAISDAATAVDAILADGKLDWKDITAVPGLIRTFGAVKDVDFSKVADQFHDLSEADKAEIIDVFKNHLDLHNEATEVIVETGFGILVEAVDALNSLRDVVARLKKKA